MKKIAIIMAVLAASFCAVSCLQEQDFKESPIDENYTPMTINAVAEPIVSTKTEMVYKYDIVWSENDKIYVTDGTAGDTFTLTDGAGQTDGTFAQDHQIPISGDVEAFYPSTMVDGEFLLWPALQTSNQTVPMYCTKSISESTATFRMSTLGAMLQLVLSTETKNIVLKSIEIRDDNLAMSGAFEVVDGKANMVATDRAGITLDLGTGVSLGVAAKYFNIAVPAGEYSGMTLVFTTTKGSKCTMHSSALLDIGHGTVNKVALAPKNFASNGIPEDACAGKFSIDESKQVVFSHGNLRFTTDNWLAWLNNNQGDGTWSFYDKQYDCEYYRDYPDEVSLLNWGYSPSYTLNDNFTGNFPKENRFTLLTDCEFPYENDWGSAAGDGETWRTLSEAEWQYLLYDRDNASGLYRFGVTVSGLANCFVLAPDNYKGTIEASYDADEWELAEADGMVCLPSAGYAQGGADRNTSTATPGSFGYYWTSTADEVYSRASVLTFDDTAVSVSSLPRTNCYSIRLVADVPISVSGLSLSSEELSMQVGEQATLLPIFTPAEADNKNVTWASSNTSVATVTADGEVKALAAGEARISARAQDGMYIAYCDVTVFQASVFSVSETRTVYFSTGNLRMRTESLLVDDSETWSMYDNQYNYEDYSALGYPANTYEFSLFNWGHNSGVFRDLTSSYLSYAMFGSELTFPNAFYDQISYVDLNWVYDWGSMIGSGFEWRTLTKDEWRYLLEGRSGASRLHKTGVRVCGVDYCLVLAPDNFEGTISSNYSKSAWAEAEAAGCICLPPAGHGVGGEPVSSFNKNEFAGYYWTATSTSGGSEFAYILNFHSNGYSIESALKSNCYSVRLVKNGPTSSDASVESISLDQTAITVAADKRNIKLNAIVSPAYATNKHVTWSSSNIDVATVDPDGYLSTYNVGTATITATTEDGGKTASCVVTCIEGLPGVFTVGPQTTVRFSFGNLYHDPTWDFKFEEHQYDSPSEWTADHIGHFFWSRSEEVAILQQYSDQSRSEDDILFTNSTLLLPNEDLYIRPGYRALSMDEWSYLLGSRPNAAGLYKCGVNVCGKKNCLILAPDDYVGTIQESYDETSWQNAEYAGLVCLPAAGYRNSGVSSKVSHYGSVGYYWTSSAYQDNSAYAMTFTDDDLYFDFTEARNVDHAIRLVHNVTTPQYTVTVPQNILGGSVSVNRQNNAIPGETIIVTATSADGYQLVALTYNGIDIMETREFVMPSENVTISATFEQISRDPVTDVLTAAKFTATGSGYVAFSGVEVSSGARYAGISAKDGSGNIQLNSKNNYGIVSTTSGGKLKSVKITVGSGTNDIYVYAKSTAYTSAADLYNSETLGTLVGSTSETGTINVEGDYSYVGIRSASGAVYLSSIEITWE